MTHVEVYEKFKFFFPDRSAYIRSWFPNGYNSVRVRDNKNNDYIFTYNGDNDLRFETVDSFIKTMRKEPIRCD